MLKRIKRIDYRNYICIIFIILLLSLSLVFKNSYIRIIESIKDLGLSIAYYFCEIFLIEYSFEPSINNITSTSNEIIKNFNIIDFSNFGVYFELSFKASLNIETLLRYIGNVLNILSNVSRYLIIVLPFFYLLFIKYKRYFSENNNEIDSDSKPLRIYKNIDNKVFNPIKKWLLSFKDFLTQRKHYIYICILLLSIYFNVFTIIIEFFAFYFYIVISFDLLKYIEKK